ncbi:MULTISPECIES: carbohydrate ABC transporter permease [unclassified Salinibacterium]|uniref:carbohydrate ABC transporter permease n=1 Tax=unclassified Salinibacterium TaxID=2632331 RepID=UPI001E3C5560|nr:MULTISPECIES: carbohydrate ABC transporter permease [unclassified Salinibacterium]
MSIDSRKKSSGLARTHTAKHHAGRRAPLRIADVLFTAALIVIAVVFFFPMLWMVFSSFKSNSAIFATPFALPTEIDFGRWVEAFEVGHIGQYALNSVIVTGASVLAILLLGAAAAFSFSRYRFRGRNLFMGLLALGLLLPLQSYFIAQSTMFTQLAITDTRWALIIPYTAMGLPLAVYLLKVYLDAVPDELFEAARIDGASDLRIFGSIALPLLRPGLATVAIFSALSSWNEFLLALLYIQDDALKTIPTGLLAFSSRYVTDYGLLFSALSIVTLPMIVIYIVFNKQIVEGITAGSVK